MKEIWWVSIQISLQNLSRLYALAAWTRMTLLPVFLALR